MSAAKFTFTGHAVKMLVGNPNNHIFHSSLCCRQSFIRSDIQRVGHTFLLRVNLTVMLWLCADGDMIITRRIIFIIIMINNRYSNYAPIIRLI